jgi:hypothetical protein
MVYVRIYIFKKKGVIKNDKSLYCINYMLGYNHCEYHERLLTECFKYLII